jgi:hypothetical protein
VAQTAYINLSVDSTATGDPGKAKHSVVAGAALSGDVTFSYDPLKLADANTANSVLDDIRRRVVGGRGLK